MKINAPTARKGHASRLAFSLIELCVAMSIILVTFVTIFGSMALGLFITQASRENLRSTQIMIDKMEGVRLYSWLQLTNSTYLIPSFTNWFFETNQIGLSTANGTGVQYTGVVAVADAGALIPTSYRSSMRKVTVIVNWSSGGINHQRSMSTLVSEMGMQNYIYNN
jgi:hypothetical protein